MKKVLVFLIITLCAVSLYANDAPIYTITGSLQQRTTVPFGGASAAPAVVSTYSSRASSTMLAHCQTSFSVNHTAVQTIEGNELSPSMRRVGGKPNEPTNKTDEVPIPDGTAFLLLLAVLWLIWKLNILPLH